MAGAARTASAPSLSPAAPAVPPALTAVATQYRGRSAIRDVAKALGLPPDQVNALAGTMTVRFKIALTIIVIGLLTTAGVITIGDASK